MNQMSESIAKADTYIADCRYAETPPPIPNDPYTDKELGYQIFMDMRPWYKVGEPLSDYMPQLQALAEKLHLTFDVLCDIAATKAMVMCHEVGELEHLLNLARMEDASGDKLKNSAWITNTELMLLVRFARIKARRNSRPFMLICNKFAEQLGIASIQVDRYIKRMESFGTLKCVQRGYSGKRGKGRASWYTYTGNH
jgi:hypothetical protein